MDYHKENHEILTFLTKIPEYYCLEDYGNCTMIQLFNSNINFKNDKENPEKFIAIIFFLENKVRQIIKDINMLKKYFFFIKAVHKNKFMYFLINRTENYSGNDIILKINELKPLKSCIKKFLNIDEFPINNFILSEIARTNEDINLNKIFEFKQINQTVANFDKNILAKFYAPTDIKKTQFKRIKKDNSSNNNNYNNNKNFYLNNNNSMNNNYNIFNVNTKYIIDNNINSNNKNHNLNKMNNNMNLNNQNNNMNNNMIFNNQNNNSMNNNMKLNSQNNNMNNNMNLNNQNNNSMNNNMSFNNKNNNSMNNNMSLNNQNNNMNNIINLNKQNNDFNNMNNNMNLMNQNNNFNNMNNNNNVMNQNNGFNNTNSNNNIMNLNHGNNNMSNSMNPFYNFNNNNINSQSNNPNNFNNNNLTLNNNFNSFNNFNNNKNMNMNMNNNNNLVSMNIMNHMQFNNQNFPNLNIPYQSNSLPLPNINYNLMFNNSNMPNQMANNGISNNFNLNNNNAIFKSNEIRLFTGGNIELFPLTGLDNVGMTCYMNSTLQCLLHVHELNDYFIYKYHEDAKKLKNINKEAESKGRLSEEYYSVVMGTCSYLILEENRSKNRYYSFKPKSFNTTISRLNTQFAKYESNDAKDLLLYLFQSMHEELNYYGEKKLKNVPKCNQSIESESLNFFQKVNVDLNFSVFSNLFYIIIKSITICSVCKTILFNFQYSDFLSFPLYNFKGKFFNIYKGFKEFVKEEEMNGDNQCYCQRCKGLRDAKVTSIIYQTPPYLIINFDYGKNKKYRPDKIEFGEIISLEGFIDPVCTHKVYSLVAISSHRGRSGDSGHYVAYCKDSKGNWYEFNDSYYSKSKFSDVNSYSPYFLIYKRIDS